MDHFNGKTYYLDESGVMQTGLKLIDKKWYVFSASGELWVLISSNIAKNRQDFDSILSVFFKLLLTC